MKDAITDQYYIKLKLDNIFLGMEIGTGKCRLNKGFGWEHPEDKPDRRTRRSDVVITARKTGTIFRV